MKANRRMRSKTATFTAPVLGLNARDPLSSMKPSDALLLDNFICRTGFIEARKGRIAHVPAIPATVETLMVYSDVSGSQSLFAAAGANIYNVTAAGALGAAVATGFTEAYWNYTQVSNLAGNFLIACNGTDDTQIYDGITWADSGFTGLALTSISHVSVWKKRVWCVEVNSFKVWYSAADAIAGALTSFTFAGVFRRGGYLLATMNWTIDGGFGTDDYFVAVTSEGEVAVYRGTDPAVSGGFLLEGVYYVGNPVGRRFYAQLGGDIIMLTSEGLIPLSKYLQSMDKTSALTDKIQQSISADITSYGTTPGWEVHVFFNENFLFVQVPAGAPGLRYQYVMNIITGAWSRFRIGSAQTWAVVNKFLYLGTADAVLNAWSGGNDEGDPIPYAFIPAFSYFQSPTQQKKFNLARVLFESDIAPKFRTQFLADFNQNYITNPLTPGALPGNLWDVGLWDIAFWDSVSVYSRSWYALSGLAYSGTQAVYGISYGEITRVISLDYAYESGGLL